MESFIPVDDQSFTSQVLQNKQPVLLEFGATWCQPCKRLEPILAKLGEQWAGRVTMAKCDVDQSADLAMKFGIMSVPTVIMFKGGKEVDRVSGLQTIDKLISRFEPHL